MLIKKQLLYATLFASSCLLSTTVVKADEDTSNQQQTATTQTQASTQTETTDTVSDNNKNSNWVFIPEASKETTNQNKSSEQANDSTATSDNTQSSTAQTNQSTQAVQEAQPTYHDEESMVCLPSAAVLPTFTIITTNLLQIVI